MSKVKFLTIFSIALFLLGFVPNKKVHAQSDILSLDIEVFDVLANSQLLGLTNLGLNSDGTGATLLSMTLRNLTSEVQENLFLDIDVSASKVGVLLDIVSKPTSSFSLAPNQSVYATNNNLTDSRIPGIQESVSFDIELTPEGDSFFESLDGSTTLPADTYTITITIFQQDNVNGRVDLVSETAEIGGGLPFTEEVDIFLRTPGDVIDANAEITNPFPQFSWEGEQSIEYRLIVVKSSASDSPESLLESARSTAPVSQGGSLLQNENLDVKIVGESFQYPASGAQPLQPGQLYYWQLSTTIQNGNTQEERTSEIWSFKLSEPETADAPIVLTEETKEAITTLVGNGTFENLVSSGFTVQSFQIDGVTYSGNQASIILAEIMRKIENGDIVLAGGN